MHSFDQALLFHDQSLDGCTGQFPGSYANMVGPFGGIIAAVLVQSVLSHPDRQGDLAAVTVNFAAPIGQELYEIHLQNVRTNRTNQHWQLQLQQQGHICATATVLLITRRQTWHDTELSMPSVPLPEDVPVLNPAVGLAWMDRYEFRFIEGILAPGSPSQADALTRLWMRDQPARPLDAQALVAMSDVFFPRIYVRRQQMVPAGTVTLTTYIHASAEEFTLCGDDYILGEARACRYQQSYFDQRAELWSRSGILLATSSQLVYFKDI